jgi:Fe-Mn family superoxide dismutase
MAGILGYQPYSDKLTVLQCENHEKLTQWGVVPLLVVDVWEHAYYLKYKNKSRFCRYYAADS